MVFNQTLREQIHLGQPQYIEQKPTGIRKSSHTKTHDCFPNRPRKRARFSETSTLAYTPTPTADAVRSSWYSRREATKFKQELKETIVSFRGSGIDGAINDLAYFVAKGDLSSAKKVVAASSSQEGFIRGVEHLMSAEVAGLMIRRRRNTISRVLKEQTIQKILGIADPLRIAAVSEDQSWFAKEWSSTIASTAVLPP